MNRLIDRYAKNQPGKRLLEKAQCKIWVKDFERDNFSDCQIVSSVNRTLKGLARCRLTRKHLQREAYRTGRQDLADLVQQAVSPKLRLSKPKLTKQLLDDHVLGKRDILPSCKAPIVDFFFAMIREARMNYLPTMLYPASRSESLTPESQRP